MSKMSGTNRDKNNKVSPANFIDGEDGSILSIGKSSVATIGSRQSLVSAEKNANDASTSKPQPEAEAEATDGFQSASKPQPEPEPEATDGSQSEKEAALFLGVSIEKIKSWANRILFSVLAVACILFLLYSLISQATKGSNDGDDSQADGQSLFDAARRALVDFGVAPVETMIGDGVCDDDINNLENGYDGGDCCGSTPLKFVSCKYCECLQNTDRDGFCTGDPFDDDCCYEFSVCDCTGNDCLCPNDGLKKCHNPGIIGSEKGKMVAFTSSSVDGNRRMSGAKFVADRYFSALREDGTFLSECVYGQYAWLQVEFDEPIAVHRIVYIDRAIGCGNRFGSAYFHVGNSVENIGSERDATSGDPICYIFDGKSVEYGVHDFACTEVHVGRFLTVQLRQYSNLQIAELLVFSNDDPGYPVPEDVILSASSVVPSNEPKMAMDSFVGAWWTAFSFKTELESHPWFQLQFPSSVVVKRVVVIQRIDDQGDQFVNVTLTLGDNPATAGEPSTNPEIGFFPGPSQTGRIDVVSCNQTQSGKYLTMQKMSRNAGQPQQLLTFAEVLVYISENLCKSEFCGRFPDPIYYSNPYHCSVWGEEK